MRLNKYQKMLWCIKYVNAVSAGYSVMEAAQWADTTIDDFEETMIADTERSMSKYVYEIFVDEE